MREALEWTYLVGRVLFSMIFLISGFGHFRNADEMAGYADSQGLPAARAGVLVSGLMILAGGLSVLLGVWMEIGVWLLFVFLIAAAFTMHAFWKVEDPARARSQRVQFLKNLSMAGASLIFYWAIRAHGYGPYTLGSPMG